VHPPLRTRPPPALSPPPSCLSCRLHLPLGLPSFPFIPLSLLPILPLLPSPAVLTVTVAVTVAVAVTVTYSEAPPPLPLCPLRRQRRGHLQAPRWVPSSLVPGGAGHRNCAIGCGHDVDNPQGVFLGPVGVPEGGAQGEEVIMS